MSKSTSSKSVLEAILIEVVGV